MSKPHAIAAFTQNVHYRVAEDGCWIWLRALDNAGYGQIGRTVRGVKHSYRAHRVMYEAKVAPIPRGYVLHHRCHTPACINPEHLELMRPGSHSQLHHPPDPAKAPFIYRVLCERCGKPIPRRGQGKAARARRRFCSRQCGITLHHKLDPNKVRQIRALKADGVSQTEIARRFGVVQSAVSNVILRRTWADVP